MSGIEPLPGVVLPRIQFAWGIPPRTHFRLGHSTQDTKFLSSHFATGHKNNLPALRARTWTSLEFAVPTGPKGTDLDYSTLQWISAVRCTATWGPSLGTSCLLDRGPPKQRTIVDRTRVYLSTRQQSKQKREKRSDYNYIKQTIANKLYPSTVHSPQHSTVPVSSPRLDTPGVRLKGTRVRT